LNNTIKLTHGKYKLCHKGKPITERKCSTAQIEKIKQSGKGNNRTELWLESLQLRTSDLMRDYLKKSIALFSAQHLVTIFCRRFTCGAKLHVCSKDGDI